MHGMLVLTAQDSSLTSGWMSSGAGDTEPVGCCLATVGQGWLPLSCLGGPQGPEAAAGPLAAAGTAGAPEARAAGSASTASEATMALAPQPDTCCEILSFLSLHAFLVGTCTCRCRVKPDPGHLPLPGDKTLLFHAWPSGVWAQCCP